MGACTRFWTPCFLILLLQRYVLVAWICLQTWRSLAAAYCFSFVVCVQLELLLLPFASWHDQYELPAPMATALLFTSRLVVCARRSVCWHLPHFLFICSLVISLYARSFTMGSCLQWYYRAYQINIDCATHFVVCLLHGSLVSSPVLVNRSS